MIKTASNKRISPEDVSNKKFRSKSEERRIKVQSAGKLIHKPKRTARGSSK